jgi:hypothetical protein
MEVALGKPVVSYNIVPCWPYLLGYRIHHSVGYTVLFPTPRVGITVFLYTESRPPDVSSRGGLLMSSRFEGWQLTDWLTSCRNL